MDVPKAPCDGARNCQNMDEELAALLVAYEALEEEAVPLSLPMLSEKSMHRIQTTKSERKPF